MIWIHWNRWVKHGTSWNCLRQLHVMCGSQYFQSVSLEYLTSWAGWIIGFTAYEKDKELPSKTR